MSELNFTTVHGASKGDRSAAVIARAADEREREGKTTNKQGC